VYPIKRLWFLLALTVLLLFYPTAVQNFHDRQEQKLLKDFQQKIIKTATVPQLSVAASDQLNQTLDTGLLDEKTTATAPQKPVPALSADAKKTLDQGAIGIIEIDKIDLVLPILDGATAANMKNAATRVSETSQIGEIGNLGIAAHRARTKGRLFNRLNEVAVGDKIIIRTLDTEYTYVVFRTLRVEPNVISILNRNNVDTLLTLITCDPVVNATHRLIVQAKLETS
jgi:sortase A